LGCCAFSLNSLFRSERGKVIEFILAEKLLTAERAYREIYEQNTALMRFLADIQMPPPPAFRLAAEYVIPPDLNVAFQTEELGPAAISRLLEECRKEKIELKPDDLAKSLENGLLRTAIKFRDSGYQLDQLKKFRVAVILAGATPFPV